MNIVEAYRSIEEEIRALNPDVTLIAVSKGQEIEKIRTLYEAGVRRFGESYFEEWEGKATQLPNDIEWHFIGQLQSRKVKKHINSLDAFAPMIQSVDRSSIVNVLTSRLKRKIDILVQVNLWGETQKSGLSESELNAFLDELQGNAIVRCRGLMAIPPFTNNPEDAKGYFEDMKRVYDSRKDRYLFDTLSIGMSSDYALAIASGATTVRVGTAIFGARNYGEKK